MDEIIKQLHGCIERISYSTMHTNNFDSSTSEGTKNEGLGTREECMQIQSYHTVYLNFFPRTKHDNHHSVFLYQVQ